MDGSVNGASTAGNSAVSMRKEVMMIHTLQLLGFQASDVPASSSGVSSRVRARATHDTSATTATLHPNMFDRPNEKLLFHVLHFLLIKLQPQSQQEFKFCWPVITPHDKSNFKRLVQSILHDLEKQRLLPLGSSHASHLNAGSGPRIVDLVWRLSTHVMKAQLTRDYSSYNLVVPPPRDGVDALDAIQLLKARIAMKSRQLQEQFVARSQVQDQWVATATKLSSKIQETTSLLQEVYEQQSKLDASVSREMFSQAGDGQRNTKVQNTTASWEAIHSTVTSTTYQSSQRVLDTALQHHGDQPVLHANQLRPQRSFSDRLGAISLVDVVKNADALIQLTRSRLHQQDSSLQLSSHDRSRMATLTRESNTYVASLTSTVQQLRELLLELKRSNEQASRELCIEVTSENMQEDPSSFPLQLCPPTPADKVLHESDLVQSLKKCSMSELSTLAATSVRKSNRRKSLELPYLHEDRVDEDDFAPLSKPKAVDEFRVFRKLHYDLDEHTEL